jgi:hypothetical protein
VERAEAQAREVISVRREGVMGLGVVSSWVGMRFWVRFGADARGLGVRVRAYECVGHCFGFVCVCFSG